MLAWFELGTASLDEHNSAPGASGIYKDLLYTGHQSLTNPTFLCLTVSLRYLVSLMPEKNPKFISDITLRRVRKQNSLGESQAVTGARSRETSGCYVKSSVLILSSSPSSAETPRWLWQSLESSLGPCFLVAAPQIFGSSLRCLLLLMFNDLSQPLGLPRASRTKFPKSEVLDCRSLECSNLCAP